MVYFLGVVIAIVLLSFGERLQNETKITYIEKGYNWSKVMLYSNLAGIIAGLLSTLTIFYYDMPKELNPYLIPFATTITAYITIQSLLTDLKILLINRNILRVSYIAMYIISLYNVLTNEIFRSNLSALILFTIVLLLLFVISPIGPSDIRAIAVALPFVISIGGYLAIQLFIVTLLAVSLGMELNRRRLINYEIEHVFKKRYEEMYKEVGEKEFKRISRKTLREEFNVSESHATPVGPFMIIPFLIYLLIYPVLL